MPAPVANVTPASPQRRGGKTSYGGSRPSPSGGHTTPASVIPTITTVLPNGSVSRSKGVKTKPVHLTPRAKRAIAVRRRLVRSLMHAPLPKLSQVSAPKVGKPPPQPKVPKAIHLGVGKPIKPASLKGELAQMNPATIKASLPPRQVQNVLHYKRAKRKIDRNIVRRKVVKGPNFKGLQGTEKTAAKLAVKASRRYKIPASLLMSQMRQESGFDPNAVSSAGAFGLSQFIPSTASAYGVKPGDSRAAMRSQVMGQAKLLKADHFNSDPQGALSDYTGGYSADAYNNPVIEGAKDFKALDRPSVPRVVKVVNPKALKRAKKLGIPIPRKAKKILAKQPQKANVLKAFSKEVRPQLKVIQHSNGKETISKGPGTLIVQHTSSSGGQLADIHYGHEPEIAARLKLLSAKIGKPIYIISAHRTPAQSVSVGGFSDDPHTRGEAADIGVGDGTLASAGSLTEAQYNSVGLHRPYYPADSHEINHVELLNGGTPATGRTSGGTGVSTGAISTGAVLSAPNTSSAPSATQTLGASKKRSRRPRRPSAKQRARQRITSTYLRQLSAPIKSPTPGIPAALAKKLGNPVV